MGQERASMHEYGVLITTVIIAQGPQGSSKHLPRDGVCLEVQPGPTLAPLGRAPPTT